MNKFIPVLSFNITIDMQNIRKDIPNLSKLSIIVLVLQINRSTIEIFISAHTIK